MMKEFNYYLNHNLARKSSLDVAQAKALIEKAEGRIKFSIKSRKIDDNTSFYIFEDIYECLREATQSLMFLAGYKPYSHEAIISFLEEFYNFEEFDMNLLNQYRILRDKIIYGGEKISVKRCKESLRFLNTFFPKIKKEFVKNDKIK